MNKDSLTEMLNQSFRPQGSQILTFHPGEVTILLMFLVTKNHRQLGEFYYANIVI